MKQFHFPPSRILLPEHRLTLQKQRFRTESPAYSPDEQRLQEFQNHLEDALHNGRVIRIVSCANEKKTVTTGIVKKAEPQNGLLHIQTLEGTRLINTTDVMEISCI